VDNRRPKRDYKGFITITSSFGTEATHGKGLTAGLKRNYELDHHESCFVNNSYEGRLDKENQGHPEIGSGK
jgi:hypothetical protein